MAAQYAFIFQKAAERPSYLRLTAALHKIRNSKKSADATSQIYSTPRAANLPTARQGQGHCTLFPNSRKIHPEGRFFTGCHIKCTPIEGLGWDFSGFWPLFGLIFGLFWPFCEGNAPFADFRSRLPDCNRSMRRRRWRLCQNFLHIMALKVVN